MRTKKLKLEDVKLEDVKHSIFGCSQCLWNSCECHNASKFKPAVSYDNKPTCEAYTYYD